MDFLELAKSRYSVRNFKNEQIKKEDLDKILMAARLSPTAKNRQEQRLIVVNDTITLEKVKQYTEYHFNAPTIIVICYEKQLDNNGNETEDSTKWSKIDIGIVTTHMCLEATNLGLGTTIVGLFNKDKIKQELNIPDNYEPLLLLPIGYIDKKPSHLHEDRLPLNKTTFYNKF